MSLDQEAPVSDRQFAVVGTRPVRPDGIDKVTGHAKYGADLYASDMLVGKILRSPHPHARIRSIDVSKAQALPGVKAIVTADDFGSVKQSLRAVLENCMAQGKALYEGHALAAVAATHGEVADAAVLCPSFYQAEVVSNPTEREKRSASRSQRLMGWLQSRRDAKRIVYA